MPLFQLKPIPESLGHSDWMRSTYKGECHVSAANESGARKLVKTEFDIAASKPSPSAPVPNSPWLNPELVACERIAHVAGDEPPPGIVTIPDQPR